VSKGVRDRSSRGGGIGPSVYIVYSVYSVCSVYLVCLVYIVYSVCLVWMTHGIVSYWGHDFRRIQPPGDLSACDAQAGLAPSPGRPRLGFGREGFPQVQILENRSASAKPLGETPPPRDH